MTRSKESTWQYLTGLKEWGSFMAGQTVDDWSWTPLFGQGAKDDLSWAPPGPGSVRGLNRLLMREPIRRPFKEPEWALHLAKIRADIITRLGPEFADLTAMDVQNCLCEYDKWERVRTNQGRPRSTYQTHEGQY